MCSGINIARLLLCMVLLSCGSSQINMVTAQLITSSGFHEHDWKFDGVAKWHVQDTMLIISDNRAITEPVRRPGAVAVWDRHAFSDFSLEVTVRSLARPDNKRGDLILVFGYVSPSSFHYLHLTGTVDSIHNGVFVVADSDRARVGIPISPAWLVDREEHPVRLEYHARKHELLLYIDGNNIIELQDVDIPPGKIGVGSFNDPGVFKALRITGIPDKQN